MPGAQRAQGASAQREVDARGHTRGLAGRAFHAAGLIAKTRRDKEQTFALNAGRDDRILDRLRAPIRELTERVVVDLRVRKQHAFHLGGRNVLQHGGGCPASTLNVFGSNCNELLASETTIMVKERFIEGYGVPKYTIGTGRSGGAYQSNETADNYPGIFDGIVTTQSFPDVTTGLPMMHDSRLLDVLFNQTLPGQFTQDQQKAISGFRQFNAIVFLSRSPGSSALRLDPVAVFDAAVPVSLRYNPTTNPDGARATVYDHTINVYGELPNGFARRPLDNVGVQYGLKALNDSAITVDQFLLVNEKIGGVDTDFNNTPQRTVADLGALHRAYVSGRVLNTGNGLRNIPIITQHGMGDPIADGDIHLKFHSFSLRERLKSKNGTAANQVIVSPFNIRDDLFDQIERWLDAIQADQSNQPLWKKVIADKPADVVDACWDASGNKIIDINASAFGPSPCNTLDPSSSAPGLVAGSPIEAAILKCQLKAPDSGDYSVSFTLAQWTRLNQIFSTGVCDWSKPGVEETQESVTWASFGPSPANLIFDITNPEVQGDLNEDGVSDCKDLAIVKASFGKRAGQSGFDPRADFNADGVVDIKDWTHINQIVSVTKC